VPEILFCDLLCLTETYIMDQMLVCLPRTRPLQASTDMAELCKDLWPLIRSNLYLLFTECSKLGPQPVSFRRTSYVFTNKRDQDIKIGGSFTWSWTLLNALVNIRSGLSYRRVALCVVDNNGPTNSSTTSAEYIWNRYITIL